MTPPPGDNRAGLSHIWLPYTQMAKEPPPATVVRTSGVRLTLADGRELIDGMASWWTACHGYNHPHITAALTAQADVMPHVMFGGLVHDGALRLAERLAQLAPGQAFRFAEVSLAEAQALYLVQEQQLRALRRGIELRVLT